MTIALHFCNITVNDVDEAIAFYRDVLGYEVTNNVENGGFRWVTLSSPQQEGLNLVLSEPHAGRSKADGDALQELLVKGVLPQLVFTTDDVDGMFEKARAAGADIIQEPMDQFWGPRDCSFRDPSGNALRVSSMP